MADRQMDLARAQLAVVRGKGSSFPPGTSPSTAGGADATCTGASAPNHRERLRILTIADLESLPPRDYLVDGWLVARALNVMYGPSGGSKSFVALDWALCIAAGVDWLGHTVKAGPVVYIAAEGVYGLKARIDSWQRERGVETVDGFHIIAEPAHFMNREDADLVIERARGLETPPVAFVVDTLARTIIGGDENLPRDMGVYLDNVERVAAAFDAASLVIHHTGWNGDHERGASSLRGNADMTVAVRPDGSSIDLVNEKNKDGRESDTLSLHRIEVGESCAIRLGINRDGLSANERQILESLPAAFGSDSAPASKLLAVSGVAERSYYRALQSLLDRGYLEVTKSGRNKSYSMTAKGHAALLPTTANRCQASPPITAATPPPLRGGSGSRSGSDSGSTQ